jgi:hypothetical protein
VAFFSATCHEPVLGGVDERVHSFLVQVESLVLFVREVLNVMDVNESVER